MGKKVLIPLNAAGFAAVIAVNVCANLLPINGKTTGELSDQYPNFFVPAGFTFSIWGVIYLLLLAFVVYQVYRGSHAHFVGRIGPFFILSCAANAGWIFAWHYELVALSMAVMLVLLGSLAALYLRLGVGTGTPAPGMKYCVHIPVSVYLGWVIVAAGANLTALLVSMGAGFAGGRPWALALAFLASLAALLFLFRRRDVFILCVVLWTLFGIAARDGEIMLGAVIAMMGAIAFLGAFQVMRQKVY